MTSSVKTVVIAVLMAGTLAGCSQTTSNWGSKQTVGTGIGAVAGGLAGSQIGGGSGRLWATGAGALLGALVGSEVGASLDAADRNEMELAQQKVKARMNTATQDALFRSFVDKLNGVSQ